MRPQSGEQTLSHAQWLHEAWLGELCSIRQLPSGEWIGLSRYLTTIGLLVGVTETDYRTRFCYRSVRDAMEAALHWDGVGDPPGDWVKEKGLGRERENPKNATRLRGIAVVTELRPRQSRK